MTTSAVPVVDITTDLDTAGVQNNQKWLDHVVHEEAVPYDYDTGPRTALLQKKVILLLGESGGGKTMFVELFLNFIKHGFAYDRYTVQIDVSRELTGESPMVAPKTQMRDGSVTSTSVLYRVKTSAAHPFFILDTPGLYNHRDVGREEGIRSIHTALKSIDSSFDVSSILFFYNADGSNLHNVRQYVFPSLEKFMPSSAAVHFIATRKVFLFRYVSIRDDDEPLPFENPLTAEKALAFFKTAFNTAYGANGEVLPGHRDHRVPYTRAECRSHAARYIDKLLMGEKLFRKLFALIFSSHPNSVPVGDIADNHAVRQGDE